MERLFVEGGKPLKGTVRVSGAKNSALALIAGTLLGELLAVNEESQGLRAVTRRHTPTEVAVEDEAVAWNLNDPAAYQAARLTA